MPSAISRRLRLWGYALRIQLGNLPLRLTVWALWALRIVKGALSGRYPWEVIQEIRAERRRVRAAVDRIFREAGLL